MHLEWSDYISKALKGLSEQIKKSIIISQSEYNSSSVYTNKIQSCAICDSNTSASLQNKSRLGTT